MYFIYFKSIFIIIIIIVYEIVLFIGIELKIINSSLRPFLHGTQKQSIHPGLIYETNDYILSTMY